MNGMDEERPVCSPLFLTNETLRRAFPIIQDVLLPRARIAFQLVIRSKKIQRKLRMAHSRIRRHAPRVHKDPRRPELRIRNRQTALFFFLILVLCIIGIINRPSYGTQQLCFFNAVRPSGIRLECRAQRGSARSLRSPILHSGSFLS